MDRKLMISSISSFLIVLSLLLSLMIVDLSSAEARPLKSLRSNKYYFMIKEIETSGTTSTAPGPDEKRHKLQSVQTLKWAKNSGPGPGQGHKNVSADSNK